MPVQSIVLVIFIKQRYQESTQAIYIHEWSPPPHNTTDTVWSYVSLQNKQSMVTLDMLSEWLLPCFSLFLFTFIWNTKILQKPFLLPELHQVNSRWVFIAMEQCLVAFSRCLTPAATRTFSLLDVDIINSSRDCSLSADSLSGPDINLHVLISSHTLFFWEESELMLDGLRGLRIFWRMIGWKTKKRHSVYVSINQSINHLSRSCHCWQMASTTWLWGWTKKPTTLVQGGLVGSPVVTQGWQPGYAAGCMGLHFTHSRS